MRIARWPCPPGLRHRVAYLVRFLSPYEAGDMKSRAKWLWASLAMTGMAGAVYAQTSSSSGNTAATPPADAPGGHWHHHGGGRMHGMMMHILHQLNLTDAQKQSVRSILASARTQAEAQRKSAGAPNFAALANPGDPN